METVTIGFPELLNGDARRIYREAPDRRECEFYHVTDLPDGSTTPGQWDLRRTADAYLGNVDFNGKRVVEVGPASGFLSFHMERHGASVACVEPPLDRFWDLVPQAGADLAATRRSFGAHIAHIRNSFWYLHHAFRSNVEYYETDAYDIPAPPQKFDIGVLASVLLHVSSPVRMMEAVAKAVDGELIIVERLFPEIADQPVCRLAPSAANGRLETWWDFSPKFLLQYLEILGFPHARMTRHQQYFVAAKENCELFTIVAARQPR